MSSTVAAASSMQRQSHQQPTTRSATRKSGPSVGAAVSWATSGHATLGAKSSKGKLCLSEEGPMFRPAATLRTVSSVTGMGGMSHAAATKTQVAHKELRGARVELA